MTEIWSMRKHMMGCACFDWQVSLETRASLVSPERRDSPDQQVSVETLASQEPQVQPLPPSLWQSNEAPYILFSKYKVYATIKVGTRQRSQDKTT